MGRGIELERDRPVQLGDKIVAAAVGAEVARYLEKYPGRLKGIIGVRETPEMGAVGAVRYGKEGDCKNLPGKSEGGKKAGRPLQGEGIMGKEAGYQGYWPQPHLFESGRVPVADAQRLACRKWQPVQFLPFPQPVGAQKEISPFPRPAAGKGIAGGQYFFQEAGKKRNREVWPG